MALFERRLPAQRRRRRYLPVGPPQPTSLQATAPGLVWAVGDASWLTTASLTSDAPAIEWEVGATGLAAGSATLSFTPPTVRWEVGTAALAATASLTFTPPSLEWEVGDHTWTPGTVSPTFTAPGVDWEVDTSALAATAALAFTPPSLDWEVGTTVLAAGAAVLTFTPPSLEWEVGTTALVAGAATLTSTSPSLEWEAGTSALAATAAATFTSPSLEWEAGTAGFTPGSASLTFTPPPLEWGAGSASLVLDSAPLVFTSPGLGWEVDTASLTPGAASLAFDSPSLGWEADTAALAATAAMTFASPGLGWGTGTASLVSGSASLTSTAPGLEWETGSQTLSPGAVEATLTAPGVEWEVGTSSLAATASLTFTPPGLEWEIGGASPAGGAASLTATPGSLRWRAGTATLAAPPPFDPVFDPDECDVALVEPLDPGLLVDPTVLPAPGAIADCSATLNALPQLPPAAPPGCPTINIDPASGIVIDEEASEPSMTFDVAAGADCTFDFLLSIAIPPPGGGSGGGECTTIATSSSITESGDTPSLSFTATPTGGCEYLLDLDIVLPEPASYCPAVAVGLASAYTDPELAEPLLDFTVTQTPGQCEFTIDFELGIPEFDAEEFWTTLVVNNPTGIAINYVVGLGAPNGTISGGPGGVGVLNLGATINLPVEVITVMTDMRCDPDGNYVACYRDALVLQAGMVRCLPIDCTPETCCPDALLCPSLELAIEPALCGVEFVTLQAGDAPAEWVATVFGTGDVVLDFRLHCAGGRTFLDVYCGGNYEEYLSGELSGYCSPNVQLSGAVVARAGADQTLDTDEEACSCLGEQASYAVVVVGDCYANTDTEDCFSLTDPLPASIVDNVSNDYYIPVEGLPSHYVLDRVYLQVAHAKVGDLLVRLWDPDVNDALLVNGIKDAPGGTVGACASDALNVILRDDAATPIDDACAGDAVGIVGTYQPVAPLSTFTGDPNGTWRLQVWDTEAGNVGQLYYAELCFVPGEDDCENTCPDCADLTVTFDPPFCGIDTVSLTGSSPTWTGTATTSPGGVDVEFVLDCNSADFPFLQVTCSDDEFNHSIIPLERVCEGVEEGGFRFEGSAIPSLFDVLGCCNPEATIGVVIECDDVVVPATCCEDNPPPSTLYVHVVGGDCTVSQSITNVGGNTWSTVFFGVLGGCAGSFTFNLTCAGDTWNLTIEDDGNLLVLYDAFWLGEDACGASFALNAPPDGVNADMFNDFSTCCTAPVSVYVDTNP